MYSGTEKNIGNKFDFISEWSAGKRWGSVVSSSVVLYPPVDVGVDIEQKIAKHRLNDWHNRDYVPMVSLTIAKTICRTLRLQPTTASFYAAKKSPATGQQR